MTLKQVFSTLCLLLLVLASKAEAAEIKLQKLIDEAQAGETLLLKSGIYEGPIVITKPLNIQAENGATIQGNGKGSVITIKDTSKVTLHGLTIEHSGTKGTDAAIYIENSTQITLKNNTLRQFRHGIYATKVDHLTVQHNMLKGSNAHFSKRGNGIFLFHTNDSEIAKNNIQFVQDGIYVESDRASHFHDNRVSDSRYGIHFMYSHDSEVEANEFHHNVVGMMVMISSDLSFKHNVATNHFHYNGAGAVIFDCQRIAMYENELANNAIGLSIQDVSHSLWQYNQLYNNRIGLELKKYGKENQFSENDLTGNVMQVVSTSKDVSLSNNDGVGNYWDDYRGYDFDRNGIGDTAYIPSNTYAHLVGKKQAYQFYFETPAVTVMNLLDQRLTPSKDEQEVSDPAPLMTRELSFDQETSATFSPVSLGIGISFVVVGFSIFYKRRHA